MSTEILPRLENITCISKALKNINLHLWTSLNGTLIVFLAVNGSYTPWSNWTACSTSCGPGQQLRHRNCTEPEPAHGGADCQEPGTEFKECFAEILCFGTLLPTFSESKPIVNQQATALFHVLAMKKRFSLSHFR